MALSKRVVSMLPSATEMLCAIGGENMLVGRSLEDNYPTSVGDRPILTGQRTTYTTPADVNEQVGAALQQGQSLYTIDEELLQKLQPDVILTQDICSVCAVDLKMVQHVASLMVPQPQVTSLNPMSLQEVLDCILQVGEAVGLQENALNYHSELRGRLERAMLRVKAIGRAEPVRVAFIEWTDPIYIGGHWTPQLISMAGGQQTLNPASQDVAAPPSYCVTIDEILAAKPEVVIICPCGLTMEQVEAETERLAAEDGSWWHQLLQYQEEQQGSEAVRIGFVDGDQMFNRPGPRLVDALEWLVSFLHAHDAEARDMCPPGFPYKQQQDLTVSSRGKRGSGGARGFGSSARQGTAGADAYAEMDAETRRFMEVHDAAVASKEKMYVDPATGYKVWTAYGHKKRGKCCGNKCRHCPFEHVNVKGFGKFE
jgi:ABC-type Fe3+-hydroxamate transport system substrate-binding protein